MSLESVSPCCGHILVYQMSPWLYLMSICPSFSISTVSGNDTHWCPQDYLSIRGRMKCEKQSVQCQATDTNFSGCNYANDRSCSDLYPSVCMDGALPRRQAAFCFCALSVTAGDPAPKCWGAHLFERQLDFLLLSVYMCCVCLCPCTILVISSSVSLGHLCSRQVFSKDSPLDQSSLFSPGHVFAPRSAWGEFTPTSINTQLNTQYGSRHSLLWRLMLLMSDVFNTINFILYFHAAFATCVFLLLNIPETPSACFMFLFNSV